MTTATHWIRSEKHDMARCPGLELEVGTRKTTSTVKDKSVEMGMMWADATGYCSVEP